LTETKKIQRLNWDPNSNNLGTNKRIINLNLMRREQSKKIYIKD